MLSQLFARSNTFATTGSALPAESHITSPGPGYGRLVPPGAPSAGYRTIYRAMPLPTVTLTESGVAVPRVTFTHALPVSDGAMSQLSDEPGAGVALCRPAVADQFALTYSHPCPSERSPITLSVVSWSIVIARFDMSLESRTTIRSAVYVMLLMLTSTLSTKLALVPSRARTHAEPWSTLRTIIPSPMK